MFEEPSSLVDAIEAVLRADLPDEWRRAHDAEVSAAEGLRWVAAWRVDMPRALHRHPDIDHIVVGIDAQYPWSEPKAVAPQAASPTAVAWPHVETSGHLCLATTSYAADPGRRVVKTVNDALDVLSLDDAARADEFKREFRSYWTRRQMGQPDTLSLLSLESGDRDIVFAERAAGGFVVAEWDDDLTRWFAQAGEKQRSNGRTRLLWWDEAFEPSAYPETGSDVARLVGRDRLGALLRPGQALPVIFGVRDAHGAQFVGIKLRAVSSETTKGFRKGRPIPAGMLLTLSSGRAVRIAVQRTDAAWTRGRDRNPHEATLRTKTVAMVGCGALGSYISRTLVQSGLGHLVLVDDDHVDTCNPSRHVLGLRYYGRNKAQALAQQLGVDFPGTVAIESLPGRIDHLSAAEWGQVLGADLVISAGIDLVGDVAVDAARQRARTTAPWVCCWTEEHATAAHAVALSGGARLLPAFDDAGRFKGRFTRAWPAGTATFDEPGCGGSFQPYASTAIQDAAQMATRLCLDVLLGRVQEPTWASWLGERELAESLGATLSERFDVSFAERRVPYPHG